MKVKSKSGKEKVQKPSGTNEPPDWYQIRFKKDSKTKHWSYAILDRESTRESWEEGCDRVYVIEHPITGEFAELPRDYVIQPLDDYPTELDKWVEEELKAAVAKDKKLKTLSVNSLLRIPCVDGYAFYIVTKVTKNKVMVAWRGFSGDRWVDQRWGYKKTITKDEASKFRMFYW